MLKKSNIYFCTQQLNKPIKANIKQLMVYHNLSKHSYAFQLKYSYFTGHYMFLNVDNPFYNRTIKFYKVCIIT